MNAIRYTLLADGTSDIVLQNHITWLLRRHTHAAIQPQFAEVWHFRHPPRTLAEKLVFTADYYASDILFVHRDAEAVPYEFRQQEIQKALSEAKLSVPPVVCVIPVRMQEAWLLFDERAIRQAAGKPSGRMPLNLPHMKTSESVPDPKQILKDALCIASGLQGRHLDRFNPLVAARRLGELLDDFTPLLTHATAFQKLDRAIRDLIVQHQW